MPSVGAPPRPRFAALITSIAVILAAVVGLITQSSTAQALVYSYSLEEGRTQVYSMTSRISFAPRGIPGITEPVEETVSGKLAMTVLEVRDDGSSVLEFKVSDVGGAAAGMPDETFKMRISKEGELLSIDGASPFGLDPTELFGGSGGGSSLGSSNLVPVFPERELEPGDTWSATEVVPMPFGEGNTWTVTHAGKHLGFVQTEYGRAARIGMTMDGPLDVSMSFADVIGEADLGSDPSMTEMMPPAMQQARMRMSGEMAGDMTSRVIPQTCELVAVVMEMDMDITVSFEDMPAEFAAFMPADMGMVGEMVMKLDRIS
jgi:hypothetical protein